MSFRIAKTMLVGIVSGVLQAQPLSLGVKGGVPLTDVVNGSSVHSEARRYTVGPIVEIGLPFSFAAEFNALFKRTGYSTVSGALGVTSLSQVRANSWEFPLLAKYYFPGHGLPVRPFVSAGYVLRDLSGVGGSVSSFGLDIFGKPVDTRSTPLNSSFLLRDNPTHGFAAGGGLQLQALRLRLSAEVRYTRWTGHSFNQQGSQGFFVESNQNQADFLVGLRF